MSAQQEQMNSGKAVPVKSKIPVDRCKESREEFLQKGRNKRLCTIEWESIWLCGGTTSAFIKARHKKRSVGKSNCSGRKSGRSLMLSSKLISVKEKALVDAELELAFITHRDVIEWMLKWLNQAVDCNDILNMIFLWDKRF